MYVLQTPLKTLQILLVEDNPGDVRLVREALRESDTPLQLSVVHDGEQAMEYLAKSGVDGAVPRPDLVLLDLNLPRKSGQEVLTEIKTSDEWRSIPVLVYTSSDADVDVNGAYDRHANCYVRKPSNLDEVVQVLRSIEMFWLRRTRLPS